MKPVEKPVSCDIARGAPAVPRDLRLLAREYFELTKPRVVALIVFTAVVGMFLSSPSVFLPLGPFVFGTLGIALAAGSAAAFNHVLDQRADAVMNRTRARPLPTGQLTAREAFVFAVALGIASMAILALGVNTLTAVLTFFSIIGYSVIYTVWLKHTTPQNIVIGGAAGAAPPILGWTAITGQVHPDALLLFLIIFTWTPPHFWALALYRREEYAKVRIPMLPVTHGVEFTKLQILLYTILLTAATVLPFATRMSGWLYLAGALALDARFLLYAWRLYRNYSDGLARRTFGYSIQYLALLFALLLVDHYSAQIREALQSALY
ncbi:protoheme IX farnesyltransferase [Sulfurifustis variabilis]|uniref:Protoheme IX farnesyltransferase n=1 Tax=Sulfurifustis variabilis TaxID=1675686 RepID=A0A1B4V6X0_9GAMM|nr:heme o synthase [Sulfurifustis variabilis]BAU47044.1 protoheme IX farnesyltransferase [Sulfurifustis variabilis]